MSKKSYYDTIPSQKKITLQSTKLNKKLTMDEDETKSFAEILACFDQKKKKKSQVYHESSTYI